ncbi:Lsr2 protein [Amycolatopsis sulphurea]|uniref:Lsr2 protein n=1 Tax=Amycolatopsis sulphurea TaxID=76022 RepID=A0A2A9G304_9PSEU|nr:Lsr2 family protein [Amycolatopsis sulphurea]PFG57125.1 Lsr2 protein [Amycolatopsis sulphurea]
MAQKVHVSMVDDLDGGEATQTVPFALDGVDYEIDLSDENANDLRDALYRYTESGRRVGGRKRRAAGSRASTGESLTEKRQRNQAIREWGRANGFTGLSDRGRVPNEVIEAYEKRDEVPPKKQAAKKPVAAARKPRTSRKAAAK